MIQKIVCLPFLKFSDPLSETDFNSRFIWPDQSVKKNQWAKK